MNQSTHSQVRTPNSNSHLHPEQYRPNPNILNNLITPQNKKLAATTSLGQSRQVIPDANPSTQGRRLSAAGQPVRRTELPLAAAGPPPTNRVYFFDTVLSKDFAFRPADQQIAEAPDKWQELLQKAEATALMQVRTFEAKNFDDGQGGGGGGVGSKRIVQASTKPKVYACSLIQQYIYLSEYSSPPTAPPKNRHKQGQQLQKLDKCQSQGSAMRQVDRADKSEKTSSIESQSDDEDHRDGSLVYELIQPPKYRLNVEFAKMSIIRQKVAEPNYHTMNQFNILKDGRDFIGGARGENFASQHQRRAQEEQITSSAAAKNKRYSVAVNLLEQRKLEQQPQIIITQKIGFILQWKNYGHEFVLVNQKQQHDSENNHSHRSKSSDGSNEYDKKKSNTNGFANDDSKPPLVDAYQREILKTFISGLNFLVVRYENLKKYQVVKQIGCGAQARVFLVHRKVEPTNNGGVTATQAGITKSIGLAATVTNQTRDAAGRLASMSTPQFHQQQQQSANGPNGAPNPPLRFAMKVINKKTLFEKSVYEQRQLIREIQVQRMLRFCGNTIKLLKIYETETYINLLMEYQEGGTLSKALANKKLIPEDEARLIITQLLLTLDFMGRLGIVHRDLKPDNILLNSKEDKVYDIRIADFGFATTLTELKQMNDIAARQRRTVLLGTPGYICPEAIKGDGYSLKSDVFCAGAILYAILTLKHLFLAFNCKEMMELNKKCDVSDLEERMLKEREKANEDCSPDVIDLTKLLLIKEPNLRPTPEQALQHPWFLNDQIAIQNALNLNKLIANKKICPHRQDFLEQVSTLMNHELFYLQFAQGYQSSFLGGAGQIGGHTITGGGASLLGGNFQLQIGSSHQNQGAQPRRSEVILGAGDSLQGKQISTLNQIMFQQRVNPQFNNSDKNTHLASRSLCGSGIPQPLSINQNWKGDRSAIGGDFNNYLFKQQNDRSCQQNDDRFESLRQCMPNSFHQNQQRNSIIPFHQHNQLLPIVHLEAGKQINTQNGHTRFKSQINYQSRDFLFFDPVRKNKNNRGDSSDQLSQFNYYKILQSFRDASAGACDRLSFLNQSIVQNVCGGGIGVATDSGSAVKKQTGAFFAGSAADGPDRGRSQDIYGDAYSPAAAAAANAAAIRGGREMKGGVLQQQQMCNQTLSGSQSPLVFKARLNQTNQTPKQTFNHALQINQIKNQIGAGAAQNNLAYNTHINVPTNNNSHYTDEAAAVDANRRRYSANASPNRKIQGASAGKGEGASLAEFEKLQHLNKSVTPFNAQKLSSLNPSPSGKATGVASIKFTEQRSSQKQFNNIIQGQSHSAAGRNQITNPQRGTTSEAACHLNEEEIKETRQKQQLPQELAKPLHESFPSLASMTMVQANRQEYFDHSQQKQLQHQQQVSPLGSLLKQGGVCGPNQQQTINYYLDVQSRGAPSTHANNQLNASNHNHMMKSLLSSQQNPIQVGGYPVLATAGFIDNSSQNIHNPFMLQQQQPPQSQLPHCQVAYSRIGGPQTSGQPVGQQQPSSIPAVAQKQLTMIKEKLRTKDYGGYMDANKLSQKKQRGNCEEDSSIDDGSDPNGQNAPDIEPPQRLIGKMSPPRAVGTHTPPKSTTNKVGNLPNFPSSLMSNRPEYFQVSEGSFKVEIDCRVQQIQEFEKVLSTQSKFMQNMNVVSKKGRKFLPHPSDNLAKEQ